MLTSKSCTHIHQPIPPSLPSSRFPFLPPSVLPAKLAISLGLHRRGSKLPTIARLQPEVCCIMSYLLSSRRFLDPLQSAFILYNLDNSLQPAPRLCGAWGAVGCPPFCRAWPWDGERSEPVTFCPITRSPQCLHLNRNLNLHNPVHCARAVRKVGCFLPKQGHIFHILTRRRLPFVNVESGSVRCIQKNFGQPICIFGTKKSRNTRFFTVLN